MLLKSKIHWYPSSSVNASVCQQVPPWSSHPHLPLLNVSRGSAISNSLLWLNYPCFLMLHILHFRFFCSCSPSASIVTNLIQIASNISTVFWFFLVSSIFSPKQPGKYKCSFRSLSQGRLLSVMALTTRYCCNDWFTCLPFFKRSSATWN